MGLLPGHVVRPRYASRKISEAMMPRSAVQTLSERELAPDPIARADRFFNEHIGIHKLLVVDDEDRLRGLFTLSDIERITQEKAAPLKPARDSQFRLLCGAAFPPREIPPGNSTIRAFSSTWGRWWIAGSMSSPFQPRTASAKAWAIPCASFAQAFPELPIIAGNVTSAAGVEYLAECGADAVKVGQGPGSICTTRMVAGVGIPQLTALYVCAQAAQAKGIRIIADGGISKSGDIVKALTLADAVICGGLLAGCPEAPGQIMEINGKVYKQYRGMGSPAAMQAGSAARYGHSKDTTRKAAAEGIEALKEVSAPLDSVMTQLVGGLQSGMGYLGAADLPALARARPFCPHYPRRASANPRRTTWWK